jgi:hypothetical protein
MALWTVEAVETLLAYGGDNDVEQVELRFRKDGERAELCLLRTMNALFEPDEQDRSQSQRLLQAIAAQLGGQTVTTSDDPGHVRMCLHFPARNLRRFDRIQFRQEQSAHAGV